MRTERSGDEYYPLFEKVDKDNRKTVANVSIIYGPNGSGKTTLAKKLWGQDPKYANAIDLRDEINGSKISEDIVLKLYDEQYILDNFRVAKDELGAHILLGDDVDNATEIDLLSDENAQLKENMETLAEEQRLLNSAGKGSLKKALEEFKNALKIAGWRDNEKEINQRDGYLRLTDAKISEIVDAFCDGTQNEDTQIDLNAKKSELVEAIDRVKLAVTSQGASKQWQPVAPMEITIDESALTRALSSVPARVGGGELVEAIYSALNNPRFSSLTHQAEELIINSHASECPLCFQSIDDHHRQVLNAALREVYNEERKHQEVELERLKGQFDVPLIELDEELKSMLPIGSVEEYTNCADLFKSELLSIRTRIQSKLDELESPIVIDLEPMRNALKSLNKCISQINEHTESHNKTLKNLAQVRKEALALNDLVCGYDARAELRSYLTVKDRVSVVTKQLNEIASLYEENRTKIDVLKSESNNTTDAITLINKFLQVIFVEEGRLTLSSAGNGYAVSSQGRRLQTAELSTGERNILSLAYFFVTIFESISEYNDPTQQRLIILDDPLSSFDEDNRYGVLIFLKQIVEKLTAKKGGQVVFFTHDARLVFNLNDAFKTATSVSVTNHKLRSHELEPVIIQNSNKYKSTLKRILNFALLGTENSPMLAQRASSTERQQSMFEMDFSNLGNQDVPSGNEVRQVLEAYSEFNFGKDISALMQDVNLRAVLEKEGKDFSNYLRGSLYKLILHGESHTQDSVKAGDYEFIALATSQDRLELCREMICLISVLTPEHVASRLNLKRKDKGLDAEKLSEHIFTWSATLENRVIPSL